jgi:hypothetical protein
MFCFYKARQLDLICCSTYRPLQSGGREVKEGGEVAFTLLSIYAKYNIGGVLFLLFKFFYSLFEFNHL